MGGGYLKNPPAITPTGTKPSRTPAEQEFLNDLARLYGHPLTEQEANLAIAQAIMMGELE